MGWGPEQSLLGFVGAQGRSTPAPQPTGTTLWVWVSQGFLPCAPQGSLCTARNWLARLLAFRDHAPRVGEEKAWQSLGPEDTGGEQMGSTGVRLLGHAVWRRKGCLAASCRESAASCLSRDLPRPEDAVLAPSPSRWGRHLPFSPAPDSLTAKAVLGG